MTVIEFDESEKAILSHLVVDVLSMHGLMKQHNYHQTLRRTYMRSYFAYFEGWSRVLRNLLLRRPESQGLTDGERCILRDEKYEIKKNGDLVIKEARYPFLNLFAATLRYWAKAQKWNDDNINKSIFGNDNWRKFQDALDVRHRLTHPKPGDNMEVSADELQNALSAFTWLLEIQMKLLGVTLDHAALEQLAKLQIEK